uniref:G protein-coupled receptor n=1 Tax=Pristionchus pacificus TaxID=54126 RepID=A0A8R1Z039_PRIPA
MFRLIRFNQYFCDYYKFFPLALAVVLNWLILFKSPFYSREYRGALAFYHITKFAFEIHHMILFVPYPLFPPPIFLCHGLLCTMGGSAHLVLLNDKGCSECMHKSVYLSPSSHEGAEYRPYRVAISTHTQLYRIVAIRARDINNFCDHPNILYEYSGRKTSTFTPKEEVEYNCNRNVHASDFESILTFFCPLFGYFGILKFGLPTSNPNVHSFICNFVLLISLIRLTKSARNIYLIPIFISCIEGLLLCLSIGTMNFTHVAREGMLICILLGPLVPWFRSISNHVTNVDIDSSHFNIAVYKSFEKLFDIGVNTTIQVFGVSSKDSEYNFSKVCLHELLRTSMNSSDQEGSNMTIFAVLFAFIPYPSAYSIIIIMMTLTRKYLMGFGGNLSTRTMQMQREFFTMQLLQSVLPLVTLVPPFLFVVFCFLMESNLDLASLPRSLQDSLEFKKTTRHCIYFLCCCLDSCDLHDVTNVAIPNTRSSITSFSGGRELLFDFGANESIYLFGVGSANTELNDGKSVYTLLTLYGFIPFPSAYAIIIVMMTMHSNSLNAATALHNAITSGVSAASIRLSVIVEISEAEGSGADFVPDWERERERGYAGI